MISNFSKSETTADSALLDDIVCEEQGTIDAKCWEGTFREIGHDLSTIQALERQTILRLEIDRERVRIHGRDRVGTLLLPSGRRCVIRTKIPGVVILEWLAYLGEFPELKNWTRGGNITSAATFQNVVAQLFLRELDLVTRVHLRKGFMSFAETSQKVKGRILSGRLAQKPWHLPAVPQLVRGRSLNTASNKLLALALDKLQLCTPEFSPDQRQLFQRLRSEWHSISREREEQSAVLQTSMDAIPDGYRNATQIARLILLGATLDPIGGMGGHTFTISLSQIWEHGLTQMCRDLEAQTHWMVEPRWKCQRLWDDSVGPDDPNRRLIADIILRRGNDRWVLDAKYKSSYGNESRNDRFQMCAYAIAFAARRATLVYPVAAESIPAHRALLRTPTGQQNVVIDSASIAMAAGPAAASTQLKDVLLRH